MAAMAVLRARALDSLARVDVLLVPTALTHWTQVGAPWGRGQEGEAGEAGRRGGQEGEAGPGARARGNGGMAGQGEVMQALSGC